MFTFRASITLTVMIFVVALAALLIAIQVQSLHWATREAASAYMDAASTKALGRLHGELNAIASLVNVLATSSSVADSDERSEKSTGADTFLNPLPIRTRRGHLHGAVGIHTAEGDVAVGHDGLVGRGARDVEQQRRRLHVAHREGDGRGAVVCGNTDTTPASAPGIGKQ